jgi:CDP-glycerol glycerophosphotransferase
MSIPSSSLVRRARRLPRALRRRALKRYYRAQLDQPLDPNLAAFAAYWYRGYGCNPGAIHEKLRELVPEIRGVWIVEKAHVDDLPSGIEYVVPGTRAYYRLLARAKYLVNNVNFPNEVVKREGTVHVQTHHGTPLKKMGLDLREAFVAGSRMDFDLLIRRCERWDYSVSANPFSTEIWKRAYPTHYETLEMGYPRNDVLANATDADSARIRAELGIEPGSCAILYAPTHREYESGFVPKLDLEGLAASLGPDFRVMRRIHYFYRGDEPGSAGANAVLDVSRHPSIEELCLAADVLVTDYSALMFDYGVLDRPIVIHAPDWEDYRRLRGTYFDLLAEPPGVVTRTTEDLIAAFRSGSFRSPDAARLRAAFRSRFCALEDGKAAERVVRAVWLENAPAGEGGGAPAISRERIEA